MSGCQTGIPFFSELQTDDEGGDGAETTEGELNCGVEDDLCLSQDTLQSCANGGEEPELFDCGALCGTFVNATCLHVGNGLHGCWCVDPGDYKTLSCTELESCLADCGEDATGATLYLDTLLRALPAPERGQRLYLPGGPATGAAERAEGSLRLRIRR